MNDEKRKNDNPQYETEWSFSFDSINERIREAFGSLSEEVFEAALHEPVGTAGSASVRIGGAVGKRTIKAAEDDALISAQVVYLGQVAIQRSGDETAPTVKLESIKKADVIGHIRRGLGAAVNHTELYWDAALTPNIPLELVIEGGTGKSELDFSALQLNGLTLEGGVGETDMQLPAGAHYTVKLKGGVGNTSLHLAPDSHLTLHIHGGVGNTTLHLPPSLAVKLDSEGGVGSVKVPAHITRTMRGKDAIGDSGVWESEGFALAERKVTIRHHGGVGNLVIKQEHIPVV